MNEERFSISDAGGPVLPRIALIADTDQQRQILQTTLQANGYQVVLGSHPAHLDEAALLECAADLWLLDLKEPEGWPDLDDMLERLDMPLLYGEGLAPEPGSLKFFAWERGLVGKLRKMLPNPVAAIDSELQQLSRETLRPTRLELQPELAALPLRVGVGAERVWLLAGGLGAPTAVREFLDALPGGLPLGLLYAQHYDARLAGTPFEVSLAAAVGRHSQWSVGPVREGDQLRNGEVVLVPAELEFSLAADSVMQLADQAWVGPFSPSIERLLLDLASRFGARFGVIVFSGLGSDGSAASAYVQRHKGQIWTQSSASCQHDSLPESMRRYAAPDDATTFSGDPRELAAALVKHLVDELNEEHPL